MGMMPFFSLVANGDFGPREFAEFPSDIFDILGFEMVETLIEKSTGKRVEHTQFFDKFCEREDFAKLSQSAAETYDEALTLYGPNRFICPSSASFLIQTTSNDTHDVTAEVVTLVYAKTSSNAIRVNNFLAANLLRFGFMQQ